MGLFSAPSPSSLPPLPEAATGLDAYDQMVRAAKAARLSVLGGSKKRQSVLVGPRGDLSQIPTANAYKTLLGE